MLVFVSPDFSLPPCIELCVAFIVRRRNCGSCQNIQCSRTLYCSNDNLLRPFFPVAEKRRSLDEQKKALAEEEGTKRKRLEEVKENMILVTERTEDTLKRMEMMGKMDKDTQAAIEILE